MPRILVYIAASVDGFIATADGGVAWLEDFARQDFGYAEFAASIDAIVIGRTTYDQVRGFGKWPYGGKRVIVLTSRALDDAPPGGVEAYAGDVANLAARLRTESGGNVWLLGGARAIRPFLDQGLVDQLEIFVMPVLLGDGIPLFARSPSRHGLRLTKSQAYVGGAVRLVYEFAEG